MPEFDVAFAQDGIAEMLTGFARRRGNAVATPGQLALCPVDGGFPWLITFGGERTFGVETAEPAGTAVVAGAGTAGTAEVAGAGASVRGSSAASVSGTSADLYLWLWNRPAQVDVAGNPAIADLWRTVRVRWS